MASNPDGHRTRELSRRDVLKGAGLASAALVLVACGATATPATSGAADVGASGAADVGASGATATSAATPSERPTATPVVLGQGAQQLDFWHGLGGADGATMITLLQQYAEQQPDLTLSAQTYDWNIFYQKFPTATAAGTPPALAVMHSWSVRQFTAQGLLQDADALFFQPGLIPKDDFDPTLITTMTFDGATQAVPFDYHGWLNWVNTKVITDAGLDPASLPKNGTDFIPWAKQIVVDAAGKHPDEDGFNPDTVTVWATHSAAVRHTLPATIWQFGGGIFSDDGETSLLNDPKTIAAVQYWHDLIYTHHVAPPALPGVASPADLFKTNAIALMWDGTWNLNFFRDNPDAQQVMQPQFLNSLAPDGTQAVRFESHMLVVPVGVTEAALEGAKQLIVYLSDNGETWATSGQVPARLSVQSKPSVQDIPSVKVAAEEFLAIGRPHPTHQAMNEIVTTYEAAFGAALANTMPPEQALNEAHTAVQAILDRA